MPEQKLLIDAIALRQELTGFLNTDSKDYDNGIADCLKAVKDAPIIDPAQAVETSHWVPGHRVDEDGNPWHWLTCYKCGYKIPLYNHLHREKKFCAYCGRRMENGDVDDYDF